MKKRELKRRLRAANARADGWRTWAVRALDEMIFCTENASQGGVYPEQKLVRELRAALDNGPGTPSVAQGGTKAPKVE